MIKLYNISYNSAFSLKLLVFI